MATNIDKSAYQMPLGLDEEAEDQEGLELEVENEEENDDMEINLTDEDLKEVSDDFNSNLAEELDEGILTQLVTDLLGDYDADVSSRKIGRAHV